jgi:hypothetical protein
MTLESPSLTARFQRAQKSRMLLAPIGLLNRGAISIPNAIPIERRTASMKKPRVPRMQNPTTVL